ncbi:hypothetical protein NL676_009558 [Syzygium grande]|nr:hypothetical protein NL676_009558 [Syzygium grande]
MKRIVKQQEKENFRTSKGEARISVGEFLAPIGQALRSRRPGTRAKPSVSIRTSRIGSEGAPPSACSSRRLSSPNHSYALSISESDDRTTSSSASSSPSSIPPFAIPNPTSTDSSSCLDASYSRTSSSIPARLAGSTQREMPE